MALESIFDSKNCESFLPYNPNKKFEESSHKQLGNKIDRQLIENCYSEAMATVTSTSDDEREEEEMRAER